MKKIVYKLVIVFTASIFSFSSCTEELDRLWYNPNVLPPGSGDIASGLLTEMQRTRFWDRDYGEWFWLVGGRTFLDIAQIIVPNPDQDFMFNRFTDNNFEDINSFFNPTQSAQRFEWFYRNLRGYGLIRDEVALMSGADYYNSVIYLKLATVLKDIVALQTVDLFNSIPFFQAFKGAYPHNIYFPEYDCPREIYKAVIESFRTIAAELPDIYERMHPSTRGVLRRQDIFFGGNIDRWVQFINAHRLRASIRISGVEEAFAKTHIAEAIENLPQEDFTMRQTRPNEVRIGRHDAGGTAQRAWAERMSPWITVPDVILTRMNHGEDVFDPDTHDPRLPFIVMGFTPDGTTDRIEFVGASGDWERNRHLRFTTDVDTINGVPTVVRQTRRNVVPQPPAGPQWFTTPAHTAIVMVRSTPWATYNPVTFTLSEGLVPLFTRAEIDLLLAEVEVKGFAATGSTPGEHIYNAVVNSTAFWYRKNRVPNFITASQWGGTPQEQEVARAILQPPRPSDAIVSNYASFIRAQFEASSDPMEIIMQQKYIHLNMMDPYELFAELRRTRRPLLEPISVIAGARTLTNAMVTLERYMLPTSERDRNPDNFATVSDENRFDAYIFWVPDNKRGVMPFLPRAIKDPIPGQRLP